MKGYKGMNADMTCREFQYEIGKTYCVDGDVKLCKNGFHFCKNLKDVFQFYENYKGNRFFEVEGNVIESDGVKCVADKIIIIRELTKKEVIRCYYGNGYGNGNGNDNGNGNGNGDSCGYGNGNGDGNGNGNGDSYGNGYGDSCGYGNGNGDSYGNGYGDSCGYGYGGNIEKILKFV